MKIFFRSNINFATLSIQGHKKAMVIQIQTETWFKSPF